MSKFKVVEVLSIETRPEGTIYRGRILHDDLPWREADKLYKRYQGRRRDKDALEGTPNLLAQDDRNFEEMEE